MSEENTTETDVFSNNESNEKIKNTYFLKFLKGEIEFKDLPKDLFREITLTDINLSNCGISELKENIFIKIGIEKIARIDLSNNKIKEIPENFFNGLKEIVEINFSNNHIKSIPARLFNGLKKIDRINFSFNKIKSLSDKLFTIAINDEEEYLEALSDINFSNNLITSLPNSLFLGIRSIHGINFSFNQINKIPDGLFNSIESLWDMNFSNNQIKYVPDNLFENINDAQGINFSDNQIQDFSIDLIDQIRYIKDVKFSNNYISSISNQILNVNFRNLCIDFRNNFKTNNSSVLFEKFFSIVSEKKGENENQFIKKCDSNQLNMNLLLIYLNKKLNRVADLYVEFNEKLEKLKNQKWTVLDFLISSTDLNNFALIDLENYVSNLLKENGNFLENKEFKIFSPESLIFLCERNNIELFKVFLPIKSIQDQDDRANYNKYLNDKKFFQKINLSKCMSIAIEKKNEDIAIYLLRILNNILVDTSENETKPENIEVFLRSLLEEYLPKFFSTEYNWQNAIESFLVICEKNNLVDLLELINNDSLNLKNKKSLLNLIENSKRTSLLNHKTTFQLLDQRWKLMPRFIYYMYLITYLTFVVFYSIHIEYYKYGYLDKHHKNLQLTSKIICFIINGILIITEILQFINSLILKRGLLYISSFKNVCEIISYPLIVVTLSLPNGEAKSVLFSITILLLYFIFITCLDKFYGIGPYINVFGKIVKKSMRVIFILLIGMIGFLLSFRNRANADYSDNEAYINNNMGTFNGSFELAFFKVFTMTVGSVDTENMGLDNLNKNNFINYFIYGLFLFLIPILFINIFTGISIDEVKALIDRSKAENIAIKINYVYNFELIKSKYFNCRPISFLIRIFEKFLKIINDLFDVMGDCILKAEYFKKTVSVFKNANKKNRDEDTENKINNRVKCVEEKMNNILIRLDQIANRFNYLEDKLYNQKDESNSRIISIQNKLDTILERAN